MRTGNENSKCIEALKLSYFKHNIPPISFDRSCDHPEGGALQRIYYKIFEPKHKRKVPIVICSVLRASVRFVIYK